MLIQAKILENSAALILKQGRFGIERKADMSQVSVEADKNMLKMTKQLLDSPEYEAICKHQAATRRALRKKSVPLAILESAMLFHVNEIENISKYIATREAEEQELVNQFCEVYEMRREEARTRLNGQFDPANYPSVEVVRSMFYTKTRWVQFGIPDNLPEKIFQEEKEKAEKAWAEATDVITQTLRESFMRLISYASERLKIVPGEKPPVFRNSLIDNIKEFIATFNSRNLTNDAELEKLVTRASELLARFMGDADIVRKNLDVRKYVQEQFEEISKTLDTMLINQPSRKFSFDETA